MRSAFAFAFVLFAVPAFAQPETKTIVVSGNDGYGTTTCLASGDHCGHVIADAMCNGEGYPRAHRFGPAAPGDVTAAIKVNSSNEPLFFVECGY
jgi:hypothetical protein